jgi:hypothetical protein
MDADIQKLNAESREIQLGNPTPPAQR